MFGCTDFHTHPVTDEFRNAVTELGIDPIEEDGFPHPLSGVMAQNRPAAAKEKHVWTTGDQKIGGEKR